MTAQELIAGGYRMAQAAVHRFVDDLSPAELRAQPVAGANSAAWILGHLAVTLHRAATRLGATDLPALPAGLVDLVAQTKQPAGDQAAVAYPDGLPALFDACLARVIDRVRALPDAALEGPTANPAGLAKDFGEGLLFGALHIGIHAGQLSTIRRALGRPPVV